MGTASIRSATAPSALRPSPLAVSMPSGWLVGATLCVSDVAAVLTAASGSFLGWRLLGAPLDPLRYLNLWPLVGIFLVAYAASGLYPGIVLNPVRELRRSTVASSLVFAAFGASMFLSREGELYSRAVFLLTWGQILVYLPLFRTLTRSLFSRFSWWGYPVIVIGALETGTTVVDALISRPEFGLRPFAVLDHRSVRTGLIRGVPVLRDYQEAQFLANSRGVRCGIIAIPDLPRGELQGVLSRSSEVFTRIILVPELTGSMSLWVDTRDLGGVLGLEVRQRLLLPVPRALKRVIDIIATLLGGLLALPLILLIAIAIKASSRGSVFYGHVRYGKDGRRFTAWKFRSMVEKADDVLLQHLLADPSLRHEWEQHHKLRNDPRITAVGRFLRKTSLDELPQIWNVLRGEMSLVGPRPIVGEEIGKYGDSFNTYQRVIPGITGLWQVSGRNDTGYDQRVRLDMYYVANWSVWLDIHILARTIRTVVQAKGAY